jgi:pyruvate carboxylase subunit B
MVLFAVIDILGSVPIIVSLRKQFGHIDAERASIVSGALMIVFLFVGKEMLKFIGIDVNSFAIAGALVIFIIALEMILGKAGQLPGKLAPEIVEKAEREGRKFFTGNPQDNYPDQLEKYRQMMWEKKWETGQDDEELFEYAMHPAQYEAYKSGKAKADFLEDVKKRREAKEEIHMANDQTKVLTVDVNGQAYRVTVAFGDVNPSKLSAQNQPAEAAPAAQAPAGEGKEVLSPLEGKFFLTKSAQETPVKVGDKVNKGDVICYVEAMKTYNAIRAEFSGTITAICANSGDSVSEDDVLMKIL